MPIIVNGTSITSMGSIAGTTVKNVVVNGTTAWRNKKLTSHPIFANGILYEKLNFDNKYDYYEIKDNILILYLQSWVDIPVYLSGKEAYYYIDTKIQSTSCDGYAKAVDSSNNILIDKYIGYWRDDGLGIIRKFVEPNTASIWSPRISYWKGTTNVIGTGIFKCISISSIYYCQME